MQPQKIAFKNQLETSINSYEYFKFEEYLQFYPPGSKSEALQLGVHLILLYFIRISLLSAETFFLFWWSVVGGGWWMINILVL